MKKGREELIDIKKFLFTVLNNWYFFVLSIIIFFVAAFLIFIAISFFVDNIPTQGVTKGYRTLEKNLCKFLISAGAKIKWIGKRTIKIKGVKKLNSTSYSIMGDRIETISWAVLTVLTGGKLKIGGFKNLSPPRIFD